jgi:hypothetical protein
MHLHMLRLLLEAFRKWQFGWAIDYSGWENNHSAC